MCKKPCKECPWVVNNRNNNAIVDHSRKWQKKHNCHMLIKSKELPMWDHNPTYQCLGNKKEIG